MFTPEMLLLMGEALLETLFMTLVSARWPMCSGCRWASCSW